MFLMIPGVSYPIKTGDLQTAISYLFNGNQTVVNGVTAMYPIGKYTSPEDQFNCMLRDFMFVCPSRRALRAMHAANASVWMYHWDYKGDWIEDIVLGDYHSGELEFVFDNQWPPIIHMFSANDYAMANTIDTYWANMVHYQSPNGDSTQSGTGKLNDQEYW